jgi:hypothetical protein
MREQRSQHIGAECLDSSKRGNPVVVINAVDVRTSAQQHFNNVDATRFARREHERRWIELAGQTSIDVDCRLNHLIEATRFDLSRLARLPWRSSSNSFVAELWSEMKRIWIENCAIACAFTSSSFTVFENPSLYGARQQQSPSWQTSTLLTVAGLVSQSNAILSSSLQSLFMFIIRRNKLDAFDVAAA